MMKLNMALGPPDSPEQNFLRKSSRPPLSVLPNSWRRWHRPRWQRRVWRGGGLLPVLAGTRRFAKSREGRPPRRLMAATVSTWHCPYRMNMSVLGDNCQPASALRAAHEPRRSMSFLCSANAGSDERACEKRKKKVSRWQCILLHPFSLTRRKLPFFGARWSKRRVRPWWRWATEMCLA
jgi:hypothetical protein